MQRPPIGAALPKAFGVVAMALLSSLAAAETRVILAPYTAPDNPSSLYFDQYVDPPADGFYLKARFQRSWSGGAPFANPSSYNPSAFTGLGPLPLPNQRGPLGGSVVQSTFQISGNEVGILMRTKDGPHPCVGATPIACNGFHKHTVYERNWSAFEKIFTSRSSSNALVIEADINVKFFAQWNSGTGGNAVGIVAGQLVFVVFLEDRSRNRIQYVIYAFDSNLNTYDGNEIEPQLEPLGEDNNGYYLTSSFKKRRVMKYTTVDPVSAEFTNTPWASYRHFTIRITQDNLQNAISALNAKGGRLSTDVMNYGITLVGINQEIAYHAKIDNGALRYDDNGDEAVMGSSVKNIRVSESWQGNRRLP